ncbi:MAG TPA: methylmalonyl-CoA mutase family protein, partial [Hyphomicrobiaceae bacterium]|nr:methylmalonyl-CoA mutase family protein [Hyphomicrobiaceae bacterium]
MGSIPDFRQVPLAGETASARLDTPGGSAQPWLTPEGIAVKQAYTAADRAGLDFLDGYPGIAPYLRGPYPS